MLLFIFAPRGHNMLNLCYQMHDIQLMVFANFATCPTVSDAQKDPVTMITRSTDYGQTASKIPYKATLLLGLPICA